MVAHEMEAGRCIVEKPSLLQRHSRCLAMMPVWQVTVSDSLSMRISLFIRFISTMMPP